MPVAGRKPNADGQKRHRVKPVHEWVEVEDKPYRGPVPDPPDGLSTGALGWWAAISKMPHCQLWSDEDWQFALESLLVREKFEADPVKVNRDLMAREKVLGTTWDFRRNLRIRYVEPEEPAQLAEVKSLDDYVGLAGRNEPA